MIEVILSDKCIECNICVKVCPTNVFDKVEDGVPVIARQSDCQTCYMCELYCPANALYVAPFADESVHIATETIEQSPLLGSYRQSVGWNKGQKSTASQDYTYKILY